MISLHTIFRKYI